eukprot:9829091-Lingulodinium_polyedra.AAC.1
MKRNQGPKGNELRLDIGAVGDAPRSGAFAVASAIVHERRILHYVWPNTHRMANLIKDGPRVNQHFAVNALEHDLGLAHTRLAVLVMRWRPTLSPRPIRD